MNAEERIEKRLDSIDDYMRKDIEVRLRNIESRMSVMETKAVLVGGIAAAVVAFVVAIGARMLAP